MPRIFEKLALAAQQIAAGDDTLREALEQGMAFAAAELSETDDPDPELESKGEQARQALAPIRERLGFDETQYLGSASAPARVDILQVFEALGFRSPRSGG